MRLGMAAALIAAGVALAVGLTACGPAFIRVEEPSTVDRQSVPVRGVEAVDARITFGLGELRVSGGASDAMDATFDYRPKSWKPRVDQSVQGTTAVVSIEQPSPHDILGSAHNAWDVHFNDSLPLQLNVEMGVGRGTLDLSSVTLARLNVQGGVGDTETDLGSAAKQDVNVHVQGGVGSVKLFVPAEAGVRVWGYQDGVGKFDAPGFTRTGSNELVNANYGKPGVKTIDVSVQRGVGDVTIEQR